MSAKILFRRPFGDPSAVLRRNPCNPLIPSLLRFYPPNQPQPPINQPYTPIPPINPTPPILPIPPIKPIHPISPICLVCCNFIAAKKPPCQGHQSRASSCGRPFMAVKNPLPSTPLLCGVHLPSLNFYTSFFCTKKTVRVCRPLYALWLNFGINLISISEMINGIRVFINQLKFNHYETIHVQTGPCTGLFRRLRPRGRSQTVSP